MQEFWFASLRCKKAFWAESTPSRAHPGHLKEPVLAAVPSGNIWVAEISIIGMSYHEGFWASRTYSGMQLLNCIPDHDETNWIFLLIHLCFLVLWTLLKLFRGKIQSVIEKIERVYYTVSRGTLKRWWHSVARDHYVNSNFWKALCCF